MKRILTLILMGILAFSLTACGPETPSDSQTENGGQTAVSVPGADTSSSDTEDKNTSGKDEVQLNVFDPEMDHKVIMDDSSKTILVVDFDRGSSPADWNVEDGIVWEWSTDDAVGSSMYRSNVSIDSVKYRYSEYYKKDVIVFCGSAGWVGIIDFATKELIFEDKPGKGPHSVELLPNGDLVVACSDNGGPEGCVLYYPLASGASAASSAKVKLDSAHGVCYDPQNEIIWALGSTEIIGLKITGSGVSAKLTEISGTGASFAKGHSGGHVLSPAYGQPGKYWVSSSKQTWVFDSEKESISPTALQCKKYTNAEVKGMAYFPDGTMVQTAHDQGGTGTYRSSEFRVLYLAKSTGKVTQAVVKEVMIPHRTGSQTYKVHVFTKDYQ